MSAVSLLAAILQLVASFVSYLERKKLVDGALAEAVAANLKASLDEIQRANKVRDAVRADLAANPGKLRAPSADSRD